MSKKIGDGRAMFWWRQSGRWSSPDVLGTLRVVGWGSWPLDPGVADWVTRFEFWVQQQVAIRAGHDDVTMTEMRLLDWHQHHRQYYRSTPLTSLASKITTYTPLTIRQFISKTAHGMVECPRDCGSGIARPYIYGCVTSGLDLGGSSAGTGARDTHTIRPAQSLFYAWQCHCWSTEGRS